MEDEPQELQGAEVHQGRLESYPGNWSTADRRVLQSGGSRKGERGGVEGWTSSDNTPGSQGESGSLVSRHWVLTLKSPQREEGPVGRFWGCL